ncbi:hypothetical protein D3C77_563500 [compost metagenome]
MLLKPLRYIAGHFGRESRQHPNTAVDDADVEIRAALPQLGGNFYAAKPAADHVYLAIRLNIIQLQVGLPDSGEGLNAEGMLLRARNAMIIIGAAKSDDQLVISQRIAHLEMDCPAAQINGANLSILNLQSGIARKGHAQFIIRCSARS